jgi:hypothetical protein
MSEKIQQQKTIVCSCRQSDNHYEFTHKAIKFWARSWRLKLNYLNCTKV